MNASIRRYPKVGDIFFIDENGKKRFVAGSDVTTEEADALQAVGVVFHTMGERFLVVGGQNTTTKKWSAVADYEIAAIPSESGSYAVKLLSETVGDFTYTKSEGTIEEFVAQLNTWLASNATKWEAYMYNGKGYLQMSTYDAYESTVGIAGTTLVKLIGNELAASTTSLNYNEHGDSHDWGLGMCRQRIEEYCKTSTRAECNPTTRLNGVTQIMGILPCSETYFNGELGDGLRENFPTYQDYIDDCMVRTWELNRGIMQYRDGRELTNLLLPKKVLIKGVETPCYSAAHFANDFDCGVEGYGAGTFYLPSMHELGLLMLGITSSTTKALDPVNVALSKRTGWTQISSTASRWSCCRYYTGSAWSYTSSGYTSYYYFSTGFTVSAVSTFTLSDEEFTSTEQNVIRKIPKYGDIFIIQEGKKRFVVGSTATKEFIDSQQAVGVVYNVNGKTFDVVAGVNDLTFPWSIACDFEITTIPSESGDYAVKLQNVDLGNFTYIKSNGTKAEFVEQLNTWLSDNAPKWEAYVESEDVAILQLSDYTVYENTCTITGCTLVKRVGSEIAAETNSTCRNQVLQRTIYNGCCRARLEAWVTNATDKINNPTTRMNGATQLFVTFPCSKAYYDGELGDGLRENFPTYQDYLDACMVRTKEVGIGIMKYHDGKLIAGKLLNKKLFVRGVERDAYPAAVWANEFDSGVEGYGSGTFHLAGMSELSTLMRDLTNGTSFPMDAVNVSLGKRTGWSRISVTAGRWSCCQYNSDSAWSYYNGGICINNGFYGRLCVSAVARFTLD